MSNENPLNLIQADRIAGSVIQFGRARRLVVRDLLGMLNCTTILQVVGIAGSLEGIAGWAATRQEGVKKAR